MASFEQRFYLENPTRLQVLRRDARLLLMLAGYAILWLTRGVIVRRAYRRARRGGEPVVLDDLIEE